jgi:hypothetical protein
LDHHSLHPKGGDEILYWFHSLGSSLLINPYGNGCGVKAPNCFSLAPGLKQELAFFTWFRQQETWLQQIWQGENSQENPSFLFLLLLHSIFVFVIRNQKKVGKAVKVIVMVEKTLTSAWRM